MRKEMSQRKRIPHVFSDDGNPNYPKPKVSCRKKTQNDDKHWDFLDEIEAPLWVDLSRECQFGYVDKDDEWFSVNHPFHQCSSRELISAFAHAVEDHMDMELDIPEHPSPKLPPLVSKSRGNEYTSNDRLQGDQIPNCNDQYPVKNLNKKSSFVSSGSARMTDSRISKATHIELAGSDTDTRAKNNLTENAGQHDIGNVPPLCDQKFISDSSFSGKGETSASTSSTITSEGSGQQQQNSLEVSSHVLGQARGFLSALKVSLRKSCVTRQASRVEVTDGRLSGSQKSSSGKSSIGSSSTHGYGKKILTAKGNKDMTPRNRDARMPVAHRQKVHEVNLSNASVARPSNPKLKSQSFRTPSINQGNAKVKQVPLGLNRKCPPAAALKAKEKTVSRNSARIPDGGKENLAVKMASSQKSSTKNAVQVWKVTKRVPEKSMRTTSVVPKERINERSKGKKTGTMVEKVYFR